MTYVEKIYNAETGETTEREYTKKEVDDVENEQALVAAELQAAQAKASAKAAIANRLGLSADELATLLS